MYTYCTDIHVHTHCVTNTHNTATYTTFSLFFKTIPQCDNKAFFRGNCSTEIRRLFLQISSTVLKKIIERLMLHPEVLDKSLWIIQQLRHQMVIFSVNVSQFVDWVHSKTACWV